MIADVGLWLSITPTGLWSGLLLTLMTLFIAATYLHFAEFSPG